MFGNYEKFVLGIDNNNSLSYRDEGANSAASSPSVESIDGTSSSRSLPTEEEQVCLNRTSSLH